MSPRQYRMGARADTIAATRDRIVRAAMELHAEQGVLATSWDEIAVRAGVSTATAYRHFSSLGELVPACARTVFDIITPPTVTEARDQFATLTSASARLEALVRRSCHCYAMGEGWLHAAQRERDFVPTLADALAVIEATLDTLILAAVGTQVPRIDRQLLFVLCNFPFWKSLCDCGHSTRAAENVIVRLVHAEATRLELDHKEG